MDPKESYETRLEMAEMHDDVLKRIDAALKKNSNIEACWLCYACFESRINRILIKICSGCPKSQGNRNYHVGIRTKLECYKRLVKNHYIPFEEIDINLIDNIKGWCKERNDFIHDLVSLNRYKDSDKKIKNLAKRGRDLVKRAYGMGEVVRNFYYETDEIPAFPDKVVKSCSLKYKCIKNEE